MKRMFPCLVTLTLSVVLAQVAVQTVSRGTWIMLAPMPLARQEISSAVLNGKIYVIAGFNSSGASTNDVQVYDPISNAWSSAAPIPVATNHNAAAVAAGKLYAFGGTANRVFVYNPQQNAWSDVAPTRFMHGNTPAVAVMNNRIYVAGGTGPGMNGNEVEVYDPVANAWTTLAPMNVPRNHTAGGAINGKLYVAGGRGSSAAANALEVYDPQTNVWTLLAPMPTGRSGVGAGVVNGELYVFGGEQPRLFSEVEVYNPFHNRWQQLPPMPTPRHGLFAAVIDNAIYLPGGATQQGLGATNVNEAFVVNPEVTRIVPIVLDVNTGSAHYTTELTLSNRGAISVNLNLRYEASMGTGAGTVTDTLLAGEQRLIPNVLSYLRGRGLSIPSPDVEPQQGGVLVVKFEGASAESGVAATARTTTVLAAPHPEGAAGLAYTAFPAWAGYTDFATIYGLRSDAQDRSNLAVFNPTAMPVTVRLTAHSGAGDGGSSVVRAAETIPGLGWVQVSGIFNNTGIANGWVTVERTSSTGAFGVYGVINDNRTSDGSFLLPAAGIFDTNTLTIPVLVETPSFRSELILANRSNASVMFRLNYRESLSPTLGLGGSATVQLGPRQQQIIPEAIDFLRRQGVAIGGGGQADYAGAVRVEVSGASLAEVFAGTRAAAQSPGGGQFGVFMPATYAGGEASTEAYLFGLRSDANNRSNVALVNTGGNAHGVVTLEVQVYDGNSGGMAVGPASPLNLEPGQWMQLANPLTAAGVRNGWVKITRKSGIAPWVTYGIINDGGAPGERTGDGAFVPMTVPGQ